jgi:hypothetical protein
MWSARATRVVIGARWRHENGRLGRITRLYYCTYASFLQRYYVNFQHRSYLRSSEYNRYAEASSHY